MILHHTFTIFYAFKDHIETIASIFTAMVTPQILVFYFIIHEVFELLLLYVFYSLIENPENLSVEVHDKIKFELNPNRFPCADEKTVTDLKNRFILTFFNIDLSQDL